MSNFIKIVYVERPYVEDILYTALHESRSINIENTSTP